MLEQRLTIYHLQLHQLHSLVHVVILDS
jgi:hypothetical protein